MQLDIQKPKGYQIAWQLSKTTPSLNGRDCSQSSMLMLGLERPVLHQNKHFLGSGAISEPGIISVWPFLDPSAPAPKSKEQKEWQEEQQAHNKELQPTFKSTAESDCNGRGLVINPLCWKKMQDLREKLTYTFAMNY